MGKYHEDVKMVELTLMDPSSKGRDGKPVLLAPSAITAVYPEPESGCWVAVAKVTEHDGVIVRESCEDVQALLKEAAADINYEGP